MWRWLDTYDFNLPLRDALDDPALDSLRVQLAGLSVREGLDSGCYDAVALADALAYLWLECEYSIADDNSEARRALADLLASDDSLYMNTLHAVVASLEPEAAAHHLKWLADLMKLRADMARVVQTAGAAAPLPKAR